MSARSIQCFVAMRTKSKACLTTSGSSSRLSHSTSFGQIRLGILDLAKHMLALQEAIQSLGQAAEPTEPAIPFFSTVTGRRLEGSASLGASYWRANLEGIIEFGRCFQAAIGDRRDRVLVIEIGPHPIFKRYVEYWTEEMGLDLVYLHTLERDVSCRQSLLRLSGQLFQHKIQAQGVEQSIYQSI